MLGSPLTVIINANTGFDWKLAMWDGDPSLGPQSVPDYLDYDMWLGPAPYKPYNGSRLHGNFRGYWDYDGGGMGDMGMHYIDPVKYILGKDDTSPVRITPDSDNPKQHPFAVYPWRHITLEYADGDKIILDGVNDLGNHFMEGSNGWVAPNWNSNINNLRQDVDALPAPPGQNTDYIWCVENREKFALNEVNGFRSCTIVNLAVIAARLGRPLEFDPQNLEFVDDDQANRLIWQPMRAPWVLPEEKLANAEILNG
jgi:hypothetical protein